MIFLESAFKKTRFMNPVSKAGEREKGHCLPLRSSEGTHHGGDNAAMGVHCCPFHHCPRHPRNARVSGGGGEFGAFFVVM